MKRIRNEIIKFDFNEIDISSILNSDIGDNKQNRDIDNLIDSLKLITDNVNNVINESLIEPESLRNNFFDQDKKEAITINENGQ